MTDEIKNKILAPAGTFFQGAAALEAGADALYAGLPGFNARRMVQTGLSSMEEFLGLLSYTHNKGKEFHCAANILVKDDEFGKVMKALSAVYEAGGRIFIVQDYGLMSLMLKEFPGVRLHASTQFAAESQYSLSFLQEKGIGGVILPRELSLDAISSLRSHFPELHLEIFIHGALCYSISGQCYFSSFIGGRSGNRGLCSQPCRRLYKHNGAMKHYFSCKDLNLSALFGRILPLGLDYLKIEGRAKGTEYTAAIVKIYKNLIQGLSDSGLEKIDYLFNRGYTEGLAGQERDIINEEYITHRGKKCGVVKEPGYFKTFEALNARDGVVLPESGSGGFLSRGAGKGETLSLPSGVRGKPGEAVWKNSDARLKETVPGSNAAVPRLIFSYHKKYSYRFPQKIKQVNSSLYVVFPPEVPIEENRSSFLQPVASFQAQEGSHRKIPGSFSPGQDILPQGEVFWVESWEHYAYIRSLGLKAVPWWTMNTFNSLSAENFDCYVFSAEMKAEEILKIANRASGVVFCDGPISLMRTRYPMHSGVYESEKGHLFFADTQVRPGILFNERRLLAVDYIPLFWGKTGGILYDGSRDTPEEFQKRLGLYESLIEGLSKGASIERSKEALKAIAPFTRGLYGEGIL